MTGKPNGLLGRDAILQAEDMSSEIIDVPEWGGRVRVQEIGASDLVSFAQSYQDEEGRGSNWIARLVALALVDEAGHRLFEEADIEALGKKSVLALRRVLETVMKLSKLTEEGLDDLIKNSDSVRGSDSLSGSP